MTEKTLVYIVDDEPLQLEFLKDHLARISACEVHTFGTREECLSATKVKQPNIVFLDYNLNSNTSTELNGIDLLKELKTLNPSIEVVMLSGQDKIDVAVNSIKFGAFDYIVKGEGAFIRAEKAIYNIYRYHDLRENASRYKRLTIFFGIGMLMMILLVIFLQSKGFIRTNPGWL